VHFQVLTPLNKVLHIFRQYLFSCASRQVIGTVDQDVKRSPDPYLSSLPAVAVRAS
jgi:hypothetical protein